MKNNLTLYYFPSCPYCQKVLRCLNELKLTIPMKNIREDENARLELIKAGGKQQVPCLFIDGKPLYESGDIVNWLKENHRK